VVSSLFLAKKDEKGLELFPVVATRILSVIDCKLYTSKFKK